MLRDVTFFLFLLFFSSISIYADEITDIKITSYNERVIVHSLDSGFTKLITIYGKSYKKTHFFPIAVDRENDTITDFKLYYLKKKKYKETKDFKFFDSPDLMHFHTTGVLKILELDSEENFMCTFKVKCKELLLFNNIRLYSIYNTDTLNYQISIPKNLSIRYDSVNLDSLTFCKLNFYHKNDSQFLEVVANPFKVNLYKANNNLPFIRLIIVPEDFKYKEENYLNNWYLSKTKNLSMLNQDSKSLVDSIINNNSTKAEIVSILYDFIKLRFKYLDVQIGMGAYIPRDVNTILKNKQGDCKDLANLLCSMLVYKGYDSHLALASTNSHICDFNFPSLSSGNHAICVVKHDSAWELLDPTDVNHLIGQPIQSLQGRTIFITGKNAPIYYKVPIKSSKENKYSIYLNLTNRFNYLEGNFKIISHGYSCNDLKWAYSNISSYEFLQLVHYNLQEVFHNKGVDSVNYEILKDSIVIYGKIRYYNKQYLANNMMYIFIDYIPSIFPIHLHENNINNELFLGSTILKNFSMTINFNNSVKKVEFVPYSETGKNYFLKFTAQKSNDKSISINYLFEYDKIWINTTEIKSINSLIDSFNKKIHETVVVHF